MTMTYAQLVAAVTDYTQNTFDTTTINVMIKQAEQRIYNTVQIANLRKNVTGVLSSGNKYLACPEDFLSTYSLSIYPYNTTTATGTSGAKTIVVASNTGISAGQQVTGTGIGTNATVRTVNGTTITLTVANSGTVSGSIVFQGDYLYLLNKDVNFVREAYPLSAELAEPKHYAIFGPQSSNVNELSSNLSAARSNVQDTDYASETASLTKGQILQQAATAMLAQANQMPNVILSLLK